MVQQFTRKRYNFLFRSYYLRHESFNSPKRVSFSQRHFEDCIFEQCDLSNTNINQSAFRNIRFRSSKLIGLQFDTCHPFLLSFQFDQCILNYSSFYQLKIQGTVFKKCMMQEVDLSETILDDALFYECNLTGTMFGNTSLRNADLYSSTGFVLDPEKNNISGARFSVASLPGLLMKYNINVEE